MKWRQNAFKWISGAAFVAADSWFPIGTAQDPSAFAEFLKRASNPGHAFLADLRDCSQEPISYLDDHVTDTVVGSVCDWPLQWGKVAKDGGYCIYLQQPERRGLSVSEAQAILPPQENTGNACPPPRRVCDDVDIRIRQVTGSFAQGRDAQSSYAIGFADMSGQLAPLDRAQRAFAKQMLIALKDFPRERLPSDSVDRDFSVPGFLPRQLSLDFAARRRGEFVSLVARGDLKSVTEKVFQVRYLYSGWLLHVPSGRLLAFDDLFVNPRQVRREVSALAIPRMFKRFHEIYVNAPTESGRQTEEAMLEAVSVRAANPDSASPWQVTLSECMPGVVVTFETQQVSPSIRDRPEIILGADRMRAWLKPEYRAAF